MNFNTNLFDLHFHMHSTSSPTTHRTNWKWYGWETVCVCVRAYKVLNNVARHRQTDAFSTPSSLLTWWLCRLFNKHFFYTQSHIDCLRYLISTYIRLFCSHDSSLSESVRGVSVWLRCFRSNRRDKLYSYYFMIHSFISHKLIYRSLEEETSHSVMKLSRLK